MSALRTPAELRERLGLKPSTFYGHQNRGKFRDLAARHPVGHRKYDGAKIDARYPVVGASPRGNGGRA